MTLTGESKFLLGIVGGTLFLILGAIFIFSRPTPPVSAIPIDKLAPFDRASRGPADASIVLVEFSDFQCPACLAAKPAVDALLVKYPSVRLVYRHFPLDQHPYSKKAAQAAEAAKLQGKFWEMYDGLFTNQSALSDQTVLDIAKKLNLKMEAFEKDWKDATVAAIVESDRADGITFGVNATPTFFLNGRKMDLTSFSDLATEVEKALTAR